MDNRKRTDYITKHCDTLEHAERYFEPKPFATLDDYVRHIDPGLSKR